MSSHVTAKQPKKPLWSPEQLGTCVLGFQIEPPLTTDETTSLVGLLNEQPPLDSVDHDLRYDIKMSRIRAEDSGFNPNLYDSRHLVLNSLLKWARKNEDLYLTPHLVSEEIKHV